MQMLWTAGLIANLVVVSPTTAGPLHDAVRAGGLGEVAKLIEGGADVQEVDFLSGSPLHIAATKNMAAIAQALLDAGADPNAIEYGNGDTPLHWAALAGSLDAISLLAENGADLDASNDNGGKPLHYAAEGRQPEAIMLLSRLGADAAARKENGQSVAYVAGRSGLFEVVDFLRSNGAPPPQPEPLTPLLATADPERGAERFIELGCRQCHFPPEFRKVHPYGPPLWGIVGAPKASQQDYKEYTQAFLRLEGIWDYDSLNRLLADASEYVPGTYMDNDYDPVNTTVPDVQDRADIIAYLRLQADEPVPLP